MGSLACKRSLAATMLLLIALGSPAAAQTPRSIASRSTDDLYVQTIDDLVTVRARDAQLHSVLESIAADYDLQLVLHEALDSRVTLELHGLPLADALRRILRGESFLLRQSDRDGPDTLWVFADQSPTDAGPARTIDAPARSVRTVELLRRQLINADPHVRLDAVRKLSALGGSEAIRPLAAALSDENRQVRIKAVYALAEIGGDEALGALASASSDADPLIREESAYALAAVGGAAATDFLERALRDADSSVRAAAIEAFADIAGEQSVRALSGALQDADLALRVEAIEALGSIGGDEAIEILQQASTDQPDAVREAADEELADLLPDR